MKRVLIVDDSPTVVHAAYDELDGLGYMVEVAYNGKDAIKYLDQNPNDLPDLIVMDIEMPKMPGNEAAKVVRENPAWTHIPIIALTGVSPETLGDSFRYFTSYLVKPFGFPEMIALVEKTIGKADED